MLTEKPEGWTWAEWSAYQHEMTGAVLPSEENNYEGYDADWYDDEDYDDHDFMVDEEGDYLYFDPAHYPDGAMPGIREFLKWKPYSRTARRLMLLIARLDLSLQRMRERLRRGLKARPAADEIPF